MAEAYPIELRERVVASYERGDGSYVTVGKLFNLGEATVKSWVRLFRQQGHVRPKKKRGGTVSEICPNELDAIVARLGDANAGEIAAAYNRSRRGRNRRHVSSIKRALHRAGYVVKKNGSERRSSFARTLQLNAGASGMRSDESQRRSWSLSMNRD